MERRVDRRISVVAWTSVFVGVASGGAWLVASASQMSGLPVPAVIPGGVAGIVLTQTRFGADWLLRGALLVALAIALVAQRSRRNDIAGWAGLLFSAAFVASLAWAGHGAAADDLPLDFLHLPADLLHLLATGAWLGGLIPLSIFLFTAERDRNRDALVAATAATTRFSTLGLACVGTLVATGVINTWFLSGSIPALVGTLYGQLLLLKIALFAAMIVIAHFNRKRLTAVRFISRNALREAAIGLFVLAVVGIIGTLPPGLHTEPRWPFPFRLDTSEIAAGTQTLLNVAAVLFVVSLLAAAIAVERKRYRGAMYSLAAVVAFGLTTGLSARAGIVPAYPTTYYASTQQYAAPSVARGEPLYAANCTECHGVSGRGDGPLASRLAVKPADLTEEHLFAHSVGDLFWWISYGRANGVMPGFSGKLTPDQRWDLINFILARAAGVQANEATSQITNASAPPIPDFAFQDRQAQNTLSRTLKTGPVLLVLLHSPPDARLGRLHEIQPGLTAAGLHIVAVSLGRSAPSAPLAVSVSPDVSTMLNLFRSPKDGGETDLMLDRNGSVRARWTASAAGGLADEQTLVTDAVAVARIPAAAANHAGHGG